MPSSGTYWLRLMLTKILKDQYSLDFKIESINVGGIIPTHRSKPSRFLYNSRLEIPRIQHSHSMYSRFFYKKKKVVLLVRDLRDAIASHYRVHKVHHDYPGSFGDFLRGIGVDSSRHYTLEKRIDFLNSWYENKKHLSDFIVIRYEDLKENTSEELSRVLSFMGFEFEEDSKLVEDAVSFASLKNMHGMEARNPLDQYNGKVRKINTGASGGYVDLFTESDILFFDQVIKDKLKVNFGYSY